MSALYFESVKDVLYSGNGPRRAGAAHTLHQAFVTLVPILAPIMPHLAEELWDHAGNESSVFLSEWSSLSSIESVDIAPLLQVRSALLTLTANAREHGVKSPAALDICIDGLLPYEGEYVSFVANDRKGYCPSSRRGFGAKRPQH